MSTRSFSGHAVDHRFFDRAEHVQSEMAQSDSDQTWPQAVFWPHGSDDLIFLLGLTTVAPLRCDRNNPWPAREFG